MKFHDKYIYIPWEFASPKKRWRLRTQMSLDDFMVMSDSLEQTKQGEQPCKAPNHS